MADTPNIERQEIHCHACNQYVQFNMDLSMNGNHVLKCPNCGHEHCRVVKDGKITDDRWDTRNGPTIPITPAAGNITYTTVSTTTIYINFTAILNGTGAQQWNATQGQMYLHQAWANTATAT